MAWLPRDASASSPRVTGPRRRDGPGSVPTHGGVQSSPWRGPMLTPLTRTRRAGASPVRLLHAVSALAAALLGAPAHAGSSAEWLSSTDGPSPIVSSKSGVGSAQATATAKVTSDSIKTLCADQARGKPRGGQVGDGRLQQAVAGRARQDVHRSRRLHRREARASRREVVRPRRPLGQLGCRRRAHPLERARRGGRPRRRERWPGPLAAVGGALPRAGERGRSSPRPAR